MQHTLLLSWIATVALTIPISALAAAPEEKPSDPLAISVALEKPDAAVRVGEPVDLRITLKNAGAGPLVILDWEHFSEEITVQLHVAGEGLEPPPTARAWDRPAAFQPRDYRPLPPGETVVRRTVTPMLPGKAAVTVTLDCPHDVWQSLVDGKTRRVENGWKGSAGARLDLTVLAEESPPMKWRYDDIRRRLADPLVPAEQKGRLLMMVRDEKHYFAARFLRQTCDTLPVGPMRDAAIGCLLDLAKCGAAYEHFPFLLQEMSNPNVAQPTREHLLAWAADSLAAKGRLNVADQARYAWPEALRKQARAQIEAQTKDRNPYFAALAQETLHRLDAPGGP